MPMISVKCSMKYEFKLFCVNMYCYIKLIAFFSTAKSLDLFYRMANYLGFFGVETLI